MSIKLLQKGAESKKRKHSFHDYDDVKKCKCETDMDNQIQNGPTCERHALHPTQEKIEGSCDCSESIKRFPARDGVKSPPSYIPFYGKKSRPGSKSLEKFFSNCENIAMGYRKDHSAVTHSSMEKISPKNTNIKQLLRSGSSVNGSASMNCTSEHHPPLQVLHGGVEVRDEVSCSFSDNSDSCGSSDETTVYISKTRCVTKENSLEKVVKKVIDCVNSPEIDGGYHTSRTNSQDSLSKSKLQEAATVTINALDSRTGMHKNFVLDYLVKDKKDSCASSEIDDQFAASTSSDSDEFDEISRQSDSDASRFSEMNEALSSTSKDLTSSCNSNAQSTFDRDSCLAKNVNTESRSCCQSLENGSKLKSTSIMKFFSPVRKVSPCGPEYPQRSPGNVEQKEKSYRKPQRGKEHKHIPSLDQFLETPEKEKTSVFRLKEKSPLQRREKNGKGKKLEQLYIDAGQRDFGHVSCTTCGMVYTKAQEEDEIAHAKYHQRMLMKLKFQGWKTERLLQLYDDGKIVLINPDDHKVHQKKVAEVREVVDCELGFSGSTEGFSSKDEKAFLFVTNRRVVGCVIAVAIQKAYPIILTPDVPSPEKREGVPTLSWCCSTKPVPALCGISRIWVIKHMRRKRIAQRLIDCVRNNFIFGCVIAKSQVAFSDPTPDGRAFAEKYIGTPNLLVFR